MVLWSASSGNEATAAGAKNSGMSDSEMDGRTHIPSLLNALLSRNRVMQMSYLVRIQINMGGSISEGCRAESVSAKLRGPRSQETGSQPGQIKLLHVVFLPTWKGTSDEDKNNIWEPFVLS